MLVHEFAILDDVDLEHEYEYDDLKRLDYIRVHDSLVQALVRDLSIMKTFFYNMSRPEFGLAYYGITIIPPTSLPHFQSVLHSLGEVQSHDKGLLAQMIFVAIKEEKYIIHFGI